jgi:hypothetical protein
MNKNENLRSMFKELLVLTERMLHLDFDQDEDLARLAELQQSQEALREKIERIIDGDSSYRSDGEVSLLIQQCIRLEVELLNKFYSKKEEFAGQLKLLQIGNRAKQAYQAQYLQAYGYFFDKQN